LRSSLRSRMTRTYAPARAHTHAHTQTHTRGRARGARARAHTHTHTHTHTPPLPHNHSPLTSTRDAFTSCAPALSRSTCSSVCAHRWSERAGTRSTRLWTKKPTQSLFATVRATDKSSSTIRSLTRMLHSRTSLTLPSLQSSSRCVSAATVAAAVATHRSSHTRARAHTHTHTRARARAHGGACLLSIATEHTCTRPRLVPHSYHRLWLHANETLAPQRHHRWCVV
jgi:hypothetical protein